MMMRNLTPLLGFLIGCGGALEERISVLEEQILELQSDDKGYQVEDKLSMLESATTSSIKDLEEEIAELKQNGPAEATEGAATHSESKHSNTTHLIDDVLGTAPAGYTIDGDTVTIHRHWLIAEVRKLNESKKSPKFVAKGGAVALKRVRPKSVAATLGFKNNDVIVAINGNPVNSKKSLKQALLSAPRKTAVTIRRGKKELVINYKVVD